MNDEERKICPLSGLTCEGENRCFPAIELEDGSNLCPIVSALSALQAIAYSAVKLSATLPDIEEQEKEDNLSPIEKALKMADQ